MFRWLFYAVITFFLLGCGDDDDNNNPDVNSAWKTYIDMQENARDNGQCKAYWRDTFYTSYPASHPAASMLNNMHAAYTENRTWPAYSTGSYESFIIYGAFLGFDPEPHELVFTINGDVATAQYTFPSYVNYTQWPNHYTLDDLSLEITAKIIGTNPMRVNFDIKVLTGTLEGISIGNAEVHFYLEKTFLYYESCCPGQYGFSGGAKGISEVYLKSSNVKLFSYPDTMSFWAMPRGGPEYYYVEQLEPILKTYGGFAEGPIGCNYDFTLSWSYSSVKPIPSVRINNVVLEPFAPSNFLRNDTVYIDEDFRGTMKTTDPSILSKGVDTSMEQLFVLRSVLTR